MSLNKERSLRVVRHLDVEIKSMQDEHINTLTVNDSVGGFAIQCNREERYQLTPQGDFVDDLKLVDVILHLQNQQRQKEPVQAQCRIIYSRRISQELYQIGMSFIKLPEGGQDKLLGFIQSLGKLQYSIE